uniref:Monooxygenase n=1 Tax=Mycena chlorophos TaxID=658473 RepID=A0ABQ0M467_MYCCL|nr:monooxygenase [Mycena chlorophos]
MHKNLPTERKAYTSNMATRPTQIAIVGAGIGGLTLARILHIRKPTSPLEFKLFESDANESQRGSFGGSLDLKLNTGQRALHAAELHGEFMKLCRPTGGALQIRDLTGKIFFENKGTGDDMFNPEIDREQLRSLLINSLPAYTVQWGHKATAITRDGATDKYTIEFASGKKEGDFDIVVGADGTWSRVRPIAWPGATPSYTGITLVETRGNLKKRPDLQAVIGEGMIMTLDQGKCIIAQMSAFGVLTVYCAQRVPEEWARTSSIALAETDEEKLKLLLDELAGWDETMLEFIRIGSNPTIRHIHAWGHKATTVTRDGATGKFTIEFASGKKEGDFDIVVGADGTWSRVRPLAWPGATPSYTGITLVETRGNLKERPDLQAVIGEGMIMTLDQGKCIIAQMSAFGVLTVYCAQRVPEEWARTSSIALAETDEEKLKLLLDELSGWDETMLEFIRIGCNPTIRHIHAVPHDSQPRTQTDNVVLLGDAAHVMSPFAGAGVNLAMADAADLAEVLVTGKPLEEYEKTMRERANKSGAGSAANLEMFFSDGAAQKFTDFFTNLKR